MHCNVRNTKDFLKETSHEKLLWGGPAPSPLAKLQNQPCLFKLLLSTVLGAYKAHRCRTMQCEVPGCH